MPLMSNVSSHMNAPLAAYQEFIDALVERRECVIAERFERSHPWPEGAALARFNSLLDSLTHEQRDGFAQLLRLAREGGIHDVLVVLSELQNLKGLRFSQGEVEWPHEPYGTEMFFDWVARKEGQEWPSGS